MTINIVNKHYHKPTDNDIYVGRPTPLGNIYSHLDKNTLAQFKTKTREESVEKYRQWLCDKIMSDDKAVVSMLNEIRLKAKQGDVNLQCWCHPHLCHAEIIKEIIEFT
jgi:hypothetical protein